MTLRLQRGRLATALARPGSGAALAVIALLLFSWPFLMDPAPTLATASRFVFGAWAAMVGALCVLARTSADAHGGSDA